MQINVKVKVREVSSQSELTYSMISLIATIASYLVVYEQLLLTVLLGTLTGLSVVYTVLYYTKQQLKRKIDKKKSERDIKSGETTTHNAVRLKSISLNPAINEKQATTVDTPTIKTIQSEYDLEFFMIRLYKNGIAVTRLKEGMEKSRGLSLNRLGEICMHKITISTWKPTTGSPFVRFPISRLIGCFHAEGTSIPSFIMDFKVKTWHLAVDSPSEVNYIVKGFKLMGERMRKDNQFMSSVTKLLSQQTSLAQKSPSYTPSKQEHKVLTASPPTRKGSTNTAAALLFQNVGGNDDDDGQSVSTINTIVHHH